MGEVSLQTVSSMDKGENATVTVELTLPPDGSTITITMTLTEVDGTNADMLTVITN